MAVGVGRRRIWKELGCAVCRYKLPTMNVIIIYLEMGEGGPWERKEF